MANTTFTGPIRSGNILSTTGTTPGNDIANVGYVTLTQVGMVQQTTGYTTTVSIPAGSAILSMTVAVTTPWTGAATTFGIGTTVSGTYFTPAAAVSGAAVGYIPVTVDAANILNWFNVGTTDTQIVVTSTNSGSGIAALIVEYVQYS